MLDFADCALQEQLEDNLMVSTSRSWYNGSYTMAAKSIKSLELHYTIIQFLIIGVSLHLLTLQPLLLTMNVQLPLGRGVGPLSVFTVAVFGVEVVKALATGNIVSTGVPASR